MANLVHECPHCGAEKMTFPVMSFATVQTSEYYFNSFVFSLCSDCGKPIAAQVSDGKAHSSISQSQVAAHQSLKNLGWNIKDIWPKPPKPSIPDHLPEQVAKAYLAAERNFRVSGMEEASAGSYGRALDIGTKMFAADLAARKLYDRVNQLAAQHRITPELAKWADTIRLIRNDALHEIDSISRDELIAIRGFTETILTYLFTLPGMLAERQGTTTGRPNE